MFDASMAELRTARFNMLMTPTERLMLQAVAERIGVSESDIVRMGIRRDYDEIFGGKPPPKTKKKKRKR